MLFIYSKASGSIWIDDVAVETVDVNELAESPGPPALVPRRPREIPEPNDSPGYRVSVASALDKPMPELDYPGAPVTGAALSMARNEAEAIQIVVEAPWREVTIRDIGLSDLNGPAGAVIGAETLTWRRVAFVETAFTPPYPVQHVGMYPDPLMPRSEFTVARQSRVPIWVEAQTDADTPPGTYLGSVTIVPDGLKPMTVPLSVNVWDFALPEKTHLRTLTWLGPGVIRSFYGLKWSPEENRRFEQILHRYQELLLEHRLGPGGEVAAHIRKNPKTRQFEFSRVDADLERLIGLGMNAFIMGTAPNLKRSGEKEYSPEFIASFTEKLRAYGDHLRTKGWIDRAYVYTYDEAPRSAWPEVRKISKAIRAAAPELRIIQCLNQPAGVKALADAVDVFDVYVTQYAASGVADLQARGTKVWLAVCCYPMEHPNLFIEYPLIDARILPLFCWKRGAEGFEYWSANAWGSNWRAKPPNQWPRIPWNPNTFGRYNGDGYLLYPGPDGQPYPSIRLKALRDGLEDYEYLWQLKQLVDQAPEAEAARSARSLLNLDGLIADSGAYDKRTDNYFTFRRKVAEAIVAIGKELEGEKRE